MKNILKRMLVQKNNHKKNERFWEIDFFRGIAIIMMVAFHFLWDLNFFGFTTISLYEGFWGLFQIATAGTFLFLVGISLSISFNRNKTGFEKKFFLRAIKIFSWAALITIFSLLVFPQQPIFFGILHLIGFSILLSIPLIKRNYINLILGILIIFGFFAIDFSSFAIDFLFWFGLAKSAPALDFFPVIPWVGVVLIGLFAGNRFFAQKKPKIKTSPLKNSFANLISFLGRKSLLLYFLHQPVLFSLVWIAKVILESVF